jgi:hypothetical protein
MTLSQKMLGTFLSLYMAILTATNPFHKFFHSTLHKNEDGSLSLILVLRVWGDEGQKKYFFSRYKHILQPPGHLKASQALHDDELWVKHWMVLGYKKRAERASICWLGENPSWRMSEIF